MNLSDSSNFHYPEDNSILPPSIQLKSSTIQQGSFPMTTFTDTEISLCFQSEQLSINDKDHHPSSRLHIHRAGTYSQI